MSPALYGVNVVDVGKEAFGIGVGPLQRTIEHENDFLTLFLLAFYRHWFRMKRVFSLH